MNDFEAERDAQITQLLEEARAELRAKGKLDTVTWQARYPDLADELPDLLQTLRNLDTAVDDWKLIATATETISFGPPLAESARAPAAPLSTQIGRYRILERIGAGGMGTVYKAEDPELHRTVAVKVPRFDAARRDRTEATQRFLREARAAAQIRHPNVCPIHDVGEHGGLPYVVMAYVEGQSLAERLRGGHRYDEPREGVALIRQVAEALAAVHAHGIVHRDLKPGNILLDKAGQAVLTDFGLAYPTANAEHLTAEGTLLGTPAYMSPEQAAGQSKQIGPWTDLYSLGVVFYQMLTGRLPFEGPLLSVLARIGSEPPPPPSHFRSDLDPGLEAIVRKAMARRPEDRYQSARELADVLEQWSAGLPVAVDSPPTVEAIAADKKAPTVVRVDLPGSEPVTVTVDPGSRTPGKVDVTVHEVPATRKRHRRLAVRVTVSLTVLVLLALVLGSVELLRRRAKEMNEFAQVEPASKKGEEARGLELRPLGRPLKQDQPVSAVAFSPDGKLVLTASAQGTAQLWEVATGEPLGQPLQHPGQLYAAACAHDGRILLTMKGKRADQLPTVAVWDARAGEPLPGSFLHQATINAAAFSWDNQLVLTGSDDKTARLWDVATGKPVGPPLLHKGPVAAVALSSDAQWAASASADKIVKIWNARTSNEVLTLRGTEGLVTILAFSPDGRLLLIASEDGKASLWEVDTGRPLAEGTRRQSRIRAVAFSPDGKRVLTGSDDGTAQMWELCASGGSFNPNMFGD